MSLLIVITCTTHGGASVCMGQHRRHDEFSDTGEAAACLSSKRSAIGEDGSLADDTVVSHFAACYPGARATERERGRVMFHNRAESSMRSKQLDLAGISMPPVSPQPESRRSNRSPACFFKFFPAF